MKIKISGKCSDLFTMQVVDKNGRFLTEHDGYVPKDLGIGGGDYIRLTVDTETGKIDGFPVGDEQEWCDKLGIVSIIEE